MLKKIILPLLLGATASAFAQKKPLDHSVYDAWKSINENQLSPDGSYVLFRITPQQGDAQMVIQRLSDKKLVSVERGYNGIFSTDSRYAVCLIKPTFEELRTARIQKKKADEMPSDSLAIIHLASGKIEKIAGVKEFRMGEDATPLLAFLQTGQAQPTDSVASKKKNKKNNDKHLLIRNLQTNTTDTLKQVTAFVLSKDGSRIAAVAKEDSSKLHGMFVYAAKKRDVRKISSSNAFCGKPVFSTSGNGLAFVTSADTSILVSKRGNLMYWDEKMTQAIALADSSATGMNPGWSVSEHATPEFTTDGSRIFFGTAPQRILKDTTLVDFETAALDLWHYADPVIPTVQLKQKERELKRSFLASAEVKNPGKIHQLADEKMKIVEPAQYAGKFALGIDQSAYELQRQWLSYMTPVDILVVDTETGTRRQLAQGVSANPAISPDGKFIYWFDYQDGHYFAADTHSGKIRNLTAGTNVKFCDEENDMPIAPREYGVAGWTKADRSMLVYDRYDIWQLDPTGKKEPVKLTGTAGRDSQTVLRIVPLEKERKPLDPAKPVLLQSLDKNTRARGFFSLDMNRKKVEKLRVSDNSYPAVAKAADKEIYLFQKASFTTSPDLYVTYDNWKSEEKLTDINPQMKEYLWGKPELYQWTTFSGKPAEGILYKPENFDPTKKYPVLIYFYERVTDNLNNYVAPSPSRSIINISFYTSRGYVVFTPDIRYTDGEPGESAYDYIVSGAESLKKQSWINGAKMGIQGQSWGGYQVSYLITRTDMFVAAGAGAPVSNMTSAYGGIRWATGLSRQYQYENTQSRIGKTLWEGFDDYVKNSPVFFADKVNTPVLIMHNDNDGAVPWYQGIEFFMGLRRLDKKAWMLQYNQEEHNLNERRNMKDLSIRLQQFFDHYLKDEPMPAWMKTGIPATRKGMYFGFEAAE